MPVVVGKVSQRFCSYWGGRTTFAGSALCLAMYKRQHTLHSRAAQKFVPLTAKSCPKRMATETTYTKDELEELSRKDLQNEAKRAGIKANLKVRTVTSPTLTGSKSSAIVAQLLEFYTSGIPFGTPLTTPVKLRSPAKRSSLLATPMRLSPVGKTPRTSTIRRGRRVTKTPARARPKMQKLPVRDQDEIE